MMIAFLPAAVSTSLADKKNKSRKSPDISFEVISNSTNAFATDSSKSDGTSSLLLYFLSAKEIDTNSGKKAIIIFVPYKLHKRYQKLQSRLIRELEKKFSGKHVTIVAQRTILSKNFSRTNPGQIRPRSRTLTSVHSNTLNDIVYPTQIVGQRTRFRADGSRLLKVYLDPKDVKEIDYKLKTFSAVYRKLTNKSVEFLFPASD